MSKLLETKAKWKVTQKATLKIVVNNVVWLPATFIFRGQLAYPWSPTPSPTPLAWLWQSPSGWHLPKLANHSCLLERPDMGHRKVWSLPGLMDSWCATWGLQNERQKTVVGTKTGEGSVVRIADRFWAHICPHTYNYVTLVTCRNFSRLPSL